MLSGGIEKDQWYEIPKKIDTFAAKYRKLLK